MSQEQIAPSTNGEPKMPQRLGELLLSEKLITADQLEDAVEAQCLYGGRLGTSLIELGYLEEEEIAKTLSRKLHLPYIEPKLLMKIPPEVIALVPEKLAWKHLVIPCRLEKKRLYLAMSDPTNLAIIDALAFRLGYIIVPVVVPEIRLMLALQKYYRLELSPRFHSLSQNLTSRKRKKTAEPPSAAKPSVVKQKPAAGTPEEEVILDVSDEDILSENDMGEEQWPLLGENESLDNLSDKEYQDLINLPEHLRLGPEEAEASPGVDPQVISEVAKLTPPEKHPISLFSDKLTAAQNRDDIASAIINYVSDVSGGAALLMIKGGEAFGWKAVSKGKELCDFDQLQIPLDQPSVLQLLAKSKSFYLGPLPKEANNILLSSHFGHKIPETVLLIPLLLRGRLVTVFYLQESAEMIQQKLPEYQKIVSKAAMAFEMLILKNKILLG